jgi:hypothetical protein
MDTLDFVATVIVKTIKNAQVADEDIESNDADGPNQSEPTGQNPTMA